MRGNTLTVETELVVEECCNCGTPFAMSAAIKTERVADKQSFYCPLGHAQHYLGESDAAKIRRLSAEAAAAKESERIAWKHADDEAAQRKELQRQARAADRRARAAMCPVDGCHRQVQQLKRHIATKHPDYLQAGS